MNDKRFLIINRSGIDMVRRENGVFAHDAAEAVAKFREVSPGFIVLDVYLHIAPENWS